MKQLILNITDNKYAIFLELMQNLKFVEKIEEIEPEPTKTEILEGLKEAIEEVKLMKAGKIKLMLAEDLIKELAKL